LEKRNFKINCERVFEGISASPGIAISKVFLLEGEALNIESVTIDAEQVETEIEKFHAAVQKAKSELRGLKSKVAHRIGEENARIFDAHQLLLEDSVIIDETVGNIRKQNKAADAAFFETMQKYLLSLENSNDFFRSRMSDFKDVKRRVIRHIQGNRTDYLNKLEGSAVILARELTPSETVRLDRRKVLGFATDYGGKTSHVAIMARSMGVPAVVGLQIASERVKEGDRIIVDGFAGRILINPDEKTIKYYRRLQEKLDDSGKKSSGLRDLPCITLDGKEIELSANLEFTDEVDSVKKYGACGIGLFRSDYLYLKNTDELPGEEVQLTEYLKIVREVYPDPVIIRTMDVGGDKEPRSIPIPPEANPFLGWRAVRISLEHKDIFHTQLRAILRASAEGHVKILFPMISGFEEVLECKAAVEKAKRELKKEKLAFDEDIEIGVMIEVPSAAIMADKIAREVDFLSIGTNDLVQYMLAVDRGNEKIAYLYKHLHPAVLYIIKHIIHCGHQAGVWVGMCGEMAGDPLATLILLGFGLDEFSVNPAAVPEIKTIIRAVDYREAVRIAKKAMEFQKASDVEKFMTKVMRTKFKNLTF